jgi:glucose-1-phosphate cytidylyltransferase
MAIKTVILAGGLGTRLKEETEYRPKPMVEVGGRPILWHIMKTYAHYGYVDFVVCLGYRGQTIKDYFLNYEAMSSDFTIRLGTRPHLTYHNGHGEQDFCITLADTGLDTMTGGRLKRVQPYVEGDLFLVTYGDGLADVNIRDLVAFHRQHGRLATVTTVQPQSRFGVLEVDGDGTVVNFLEKPRLDGWVSAGFFVFHRRVFDYLGGHDCVLEREPLTRLAADGQLCAYPHHGFFFPMDTYRDYLQLNELWYSGKTPWKVWS